MHIDEKCTFAITKEYNYKKKLEALYTFVKIKALIILIEV